MLKAAVKKVLGSRHIREAKKLQPLVDEINEFFEEYQSLSEERLKGKTDEFRAFIADATAEIRDEIEELREDATVLPARTVLVQIYWLGPKRGRSIVKPVSLEGDFGRAKIQ